MSSEKELDKKDAETETEKYEKETDLLKKDCADLRRHLEVCPLFIEFFY